MSALDGSRLLKVHVDAVLESLPEALAAKQVEGKEAFARVVAEAVLTATDGDKTRYVVVAFPAAGETRVFGPYLTFDAASKAFDSGLPVPSTNLGATIVPLIPAPKRQKETP